MIVFCSGFVFQEFFQSGELFDPLLAQRLRTEYRVVTIDIFILSMVVTIFPIAKNPEYFQSTLQKSSFSLLRNLVFFVDFFL